jgi:hypothetical protein
MKRKILFSVIMLTILGLFTMQSCKKEAPVKQTLYVAAMPSAPVPAVDEIIPFTGTGQQIVLQWTGTATNAVTWNVYFGDNDAPDQVATGLTVNTYTAHITKGGAYFWQVETTDANGIITRSPVWSFEVNSNPNVPALKTPANNAVAVSKTVALTWTATDPEEDDLTYDIYVGTTATPAVAASGLTSATYSPTLAYNTVYYWKVVAHDPFGGVSTSVVNKFTTDIFHPDFAVFTGTASELAPSISATALHNVTVQRIGTSNVIALFLPLADAMVDAGWGTVYTLTHPILITYDPVALTVTSTKQAWCDSFIDPTEMGPMSLTVVSGTIDATTKKIVIKWKVSGNAYWGADYTMANSTYTMK